MPDLIVSLTVPSADVPTLRAMALRDFSGFAEAGSEEERELAEESAQILDALGWDTPTAGDREIAVREQFLRGMLAVIVGDACADLESSDSEEFQDALDRLERCTRILRALLEGEVMR